MCDNQNLRSLGLLIFGIYVCRLETDILVFSFSFGFLIMCMYCKYC